MVENIDVKKELEREIELGLEKEKLKDVISLIKEEILRYVRSRKEFTDYIVDYRKKVIEEYRDDEDKIIEYFDHERFVKEETYKTIDKKLKELTILKDSPYFGRIDFSEESYGIDTIYIGRFGLTPEESNEPVVIDWRAPVASLFYQGKLGEVSYKAPMGDIDVNILLKRQFIIKNQDLKGMFDSELDIKDEILQMVLSKTAGDKLKDIIMTIQKEQDEIIRQPKYKTTVVNGVAGSGKTTIALHRVAYLLYNYRDIFQDKVLILGPNKIFMEYISNVLPELGETGVKQSTFTEFAQDILGLEEIMCYKEYMERILSNDEELIKEMQHKTSGAYIEELDELIGKLEKTIYNVENIIFRNKVVITAHEIKEMFEHYYKRMPLFKRSNKIKRIIYSKLRDCRDEEFRKIQKEYKEAVKGISKEELEFQKNNLEFERKIKIRNLIKDIMNIKKGIDWLENPDCLEIYNKFNGYKQLNQDDLAPILYLKIKLEGFKYDEEIKHVVIDEAQDYSTLQFKIVKEITKAPALTILGDINQRILPIKGKIPMKHIKEIFSDADTEYYNLNRSYRSTKEIMEYANQYLSGEKIVPLVRNGEQVIEKKISKYDTLKECIIDKIMRYKEKGYDSIAVISNSLKETEKIYSLIKDKVHVKIIDNEEIVYHSGIVIIPTYFAKGLEFDAVIMVDDYSEFEDENKPNENKIKYVTATRALHELYVYKIIHKEYFE
jgi:DNA helicase-2/ATP-dependent DNA helicase PcrA